MKKKKIIAIVSGILLIAGSIGGIAFATGKCDEILLKENQRYVYAYITSIQGNEITYMELEESVVTAMLEPETREQETVAEDDKNKEEENSAPAGEMPDMGSFPGGGEMPDMSNFPGGFGNGEASETDRDNKGSGRGENTGLQFGSMAETVTTYIPVGVTVHTAADVSTTFSRLADGDLVKMLVESNDAETEVIEEIWMLQ